MAVASILAAEYTKAGSLSPGKAFTVRDSLARIANELAREFTEDNPRFDRARFMAACGLT